MPYIAVFGLTYLVVAIAVFAILAGRTARVGAGMLNEGMPRESVDAFYQSMRGKTILATLQATTITGTLLGGLISLVVWLFR
ncbi:MAG: hypothetical protein ACK5OI_04160 [Curvibacter sp.]|jgi:hypothetical protein